MKQLLAVLLIVFSANAASADHGFTCKWNYLNEWECTSKPHPKQCNDSPTICQIKYEVGICLLIYNTELIGDSKTAKRNYDICIAKIKTKHNIP